MKKIILVFLLTFIVGCTDTENTNQSNDEAKFNEVCTDAGYEWMLMKPTMNGKIMQDQEGCWGCMVEGIEHVCDMDQYTELTNKKSSSNTKVMLNSPKGIKENEQIILEFEVIENEKPADIVISHEMPFHTIIISEDFSLFAHVHPRQKNKGVFALEHEFMKSGRYMIGTNYATQSGQHSKNFILNVSGNDANEFKKDFSKQKNFAGYNVKFTVDNLKAREESTIKYHLQKEKPLNDLEPYLGAAMHIAIVKQNLAEFLHVHGEVHSSEQNNMNGMDGMHEMTKNSMGKMDHMMNMPSSHDHSVPASFGPEVEAHVTFPSKGVYNIFGEFNHDNKVIVTSFMVEVV